MIALTALIPCTIIVISVLWLKRSVVFAATIAALISLFLWCLGVFIPPTLVHFQNALVDTVILQILVAAIMLPGVLFIEVSERAGATAAIGNITRHLDLNDNDTAIVIAVGFGILIESLTGFGVSLLVTVPLLIARFKRQQAIGLALIGMSLMPWGALSISAHLGAELAKIPVEQFARMVWCVSGPVAFTLPLLCLFFASHPNIKDIASCLV